MGVLSSLFKSNNTVDLPVKVDMHSHIIPGIDDGSKSFEESISLIKSLHNLGYEKFICTPHIMGDYYRNTIETIQKPFSSLVNGLEKESINVDLSFAAEYYIDESFSERLRKKEKLLCLSQNYVLIETSYVNKPSNLREVIFELQMQGYKIVLAHPERYSYMYHDFEEYEKLVELGVLLQLNFTSLSGYYGIPAMKIANKMIDKNIISFIGTDCHNEKHIQVLKKTLTEKYSGKLKNLNLLNNSLV